MLNDTRESERQKTINELSNLLHVVQGVGQRLAAETHGDDYDLVRELNELLHQARAQLDRVKGDTGGERRATPR